MRLVLPVVECTIYTVQSNLFASYGHQGDRNNKCPYYRGIRFREVGFLWISVSQGPRELSAIERCRIIEVSVRVRSTVRAFFFFLYLQIVNLLSLQFLTMAIQSM